MKFLNVHRVLRSLEILDRWSEIRITVVIVVLEEGMSINLTIDNFSFALLLSNS
jgi:hypothetical protein